MSKKIKVVKKVKKQVEEKAMTPRFYIKNVGEKLNVMHSLTHCYLGMFDTREEVYDFIEELNEWGERELYEEIILVKRVTVPTGKSSGIITNPEEDEQWYKSAWRFYTEDFYREFPELYQGEQGEIPYALVRQIMNSEADKWASKYSEEREIATRGGAEEKVVPLERKPKLKVKPKKPGKKPGKKSVKKSLKKLKKIKVDIF